MNAEVKVPKQDTHYAQHGQWQAFLNLKFARTSRGVRLVEKAHRGPLYIQKPFYPEGEGVPHAYLLHPPGGLVSGDDLSISVQVEPDAHALITTPGAGRMYKAREDNRPQIQRIEINVSANASAEWLPLEGIVFPQANAEIHNDVRLEDGAKVFYWEVLSLGLPANQQAFDSGSFNQNLTIHCGDRLALQERFVVNDENRQILNAKIGLQQRPVQGLMVAGPFDESPDELIRQCREALSESKECIGVTNCGAFVVVRALGECSERTRLALQTLWGILRPALLGRNACPPRIWNT